MVTKYACIKAITSGSTLQLSVWRNGARAARGERTMVQLGTCSSQWFPANLKLPFCKQYFDRLREKVASASGAKLPCKLQ